MRTFDDYLAQYDKDKSVRWIEPMSSHEINIYEYEPKVEEFAELKYDGHRGRVEFGEVARCFSRVVSKKSRWFTENTDNVPHIRDSAFPEMFGTVLDGEFDYGNTSMGVQSVMGALPEKAIAFQEENGYIPFKAFDILYYKGINVQRMPLWKRKIYLAMSIMELREHTIDNEHNFQYADMYMTQETRFEFLKHVTDYTYNGNEQDTRDLYLNQFILDHTKLVDSYSELYSKFIEEELEGIMLKTMHGIYEQKRSKNYLKVKGQSTWDCVVMGYTEPTKEYTGKELHKWTYWEVDGKLKELSGEGEAIELASTTHQYAIPVTKPYFMGWCGAIQFGVWKPFRETEELERILGIKYELSDLEVDQLADEGCIRYDESTGDSLVLVHVGDCKGLTEKNLELIRKQGDELIGTVVEVKANGILDEEKGSLRHPRFGKWRKDKTSEMCVWKDHIRKL